MVVGGLRRLRGLVPRVVALRVVRHVGEGTMGMGVLLRLLGLNDGLLGLHRCGLTWALGGREDAANLVALTVDLHTVLKVEGRDHIVTSSDNSKVVGSILRKSLSPEDHHA